MFTLEYFFGYLAEWHKVVGQAMLGNCSTHTKNY